MTSDDYSPSVHYDRVTEAWGLLLGDDLHYGYFETGDEPLSVATSALTARMIAEADLEPGLRVLDVGCGTGAPACQLAREYGVEVLGITTSPVGVAAAARRALQANLHAVAFEMRDGTDNGLPESSFDRAWVMESSHLMADRSGLINECARVLRPGGRLVLCDIIRRREISFAELRSRRRDFAVLRAAFGSARMDTLQQYSGYLEAAGLATVRIEDITVQTLATFDRWQRNAALNRTEVTAIVGERSFAEFVESADILRGFWEDGTLGYGLVSATRPGAFR